MITTRVQQTDSFKKQLRVQSMNSFLKHKQGKALSKKINNYIMDCIWQVIDNNYHTDKYLTQFDQLVSRHELDPVFV